MKTKENNQLKKLSNKELYIVCGGNTKGYFGKIGQAIVNILVKEGK